MISPDYSDIRVIPQEHQEAAASANWQPATKMVHPKTNDARWVPSNQVDAAKQAGYVDTTVAAADQESHPFQGLGSAAKDNAIGLATSGGLVGAVKDLYETWSQVPPIYRAFAHAWSQGQGVGTAIAAADAEAKRQQDAHDQLKVAIKQFDENPNQAAWNAVLQLGTVIVGAEVPRLAGELRAGAGAGEAEAADTGRAGTVKNVLKGGQPNLQSGIREAAQTGGEIAAARGAAEVPETVNVPDQYKAIVDEAMKSEPAWTPEKAKPVADALGKDYEVRGSVGEGKSTDNDLDIWQKKGDLKDAAEPLKKQGFEYSHDTPHGEVWTNGSQHVDLWDSEHEPIAGKGADTTPEITVETKKPTGGVRTAIEDVSNDVKAKSQGLYRQLDKMSGGRWQRFEDQISNLNDKMDEVNGVDDDAYDRLETKRNDIETSQAQMLEDLKEKGVDPKIADDAVAHYKQAMALKDLDKAVKASTSGDVRIGQTETVNPKVFTTRVQKLYDSGRLSQALGQDGADALLKEAYAAKKARSIRNWTGAIAGLGAAYAGFGHLFGVAKTVAEAAALP